MAAACAVGGFVEVAVEEDSGCALLTTSRTAIDANTVDVHIGIFSGCSLDPRNAVGETCVLEVLVADLFELLAAVAGAHGIELHDNETELGQSGGIVVIGLESLGDVAVAGARVDVFDDGVTLRWVEVRGTLDDAPHGCLAVSAGSRENLGCCPSSSEEGREVGSREDFLGDTITEHADYSSGRCIGGGIGVDEGGVICIEACIVVTRLRGEVSEPCAVEVYAVVMDVVRVFVFVAAVSCKEDEAFLLINMEHLANAPGAGGEDSPPALPIREGVVTFAERG